MTTTTPKRACAKCGDCSYAHSAVWSFARGVQCLCVGCWAIGWRFTDTGDIARGSYAALQAALDARQRAKEDEA